MGINDIISSYDLVHDVVIDALRAQDIHCEEQDMLRFIGKSYVRFLAHEKKDLSLKFPYYNETFLMDLVDYITNVDLAIKIIIGPTYFNYSDTCLFDGFRYNETNSKSSDSFVPFIKKANDTLFFGEDIIVSEKRFFPLFKTSQMGQNLTPTVYNAFYLLSKIARTNLVNAPVLIDVQKRNTLFLSKSLDLQNTVLIRCVTQNDIDRKNNLDQILDELNLIDILAAITIKYPYATGIDSRILREFPSAKKFEICLKTRACFSEIDDKDVVLLKREIEGIDLSIAHSISNFEIIDTNHESSLFVDLRDLKTSWTESRFNPYKSPFPGKWLLCINQGEPIDFWLDNFSNDFPLVTGLLLAKARKIIEQIYEINWVDAFFTPELDAVAVVPNSNLFPKVFGSFQNYLRNRFKRIYVYIDKLPFKTFEGRKIVFFDPFNKVMFSNLGNILESSSIRTVCPDFIYYNYQPFAKWLIASYQYDALLLGARKWFDEANHAKRSSEWVTMKKEILKDTLTSLRTYEKKYTIKDEEVFDAGTEEPDKLNEDLQQEYTESEVIEVLERSGRNAHDKKTNSLEIQTIKSKYVLRPKDLVLVAQNNHIVQTAAKNVIVGLSFIPLIEIDSAVDKKIIAEKMISIPKMAINWKNELYKRSLINPAIYGLMGLSVLESTFQNDYISEDEAANANDIHLPRARMDWGVVCNYLGIQEIESVWRFHKCKENINSLKNGYRDVMSFLIDQSLFGKNLDTDTLTEMADIFEKNIGIRENEKERIETISAIVKQLARQLELEEIVAINIKENG